MKAVQRPSAIRVVAAIAALTGCSSNPIAIPPSPPSAVIAVVGGDMQTGPAGTPLPVAYAVRVTADGAPVAHQAVQWTVTGGGGTISSTSTTDAAGIATAVETLGAPGPQAVSVTTGSGQPVARLSATAAEAAGTALAVATVPVPANYGIHDTYVRDGIAFVCAWNTGVQIYDVGNGMRGGSPSNPALITTFVPSSDGVPGGAEVHNAWWFHNPVLNEKRYLFLGQEGPGNLGFSSSGDLHVIDVSDLANPREVAVYAMAGAGVHNFWMDESAARLYAAYYNGGVVAFDVSGTLPADLGSRVIATAKPGGAAGTYVWGVQLANGALWAVDMLSGFWKLDPVTLATLGGGDNVPDRYGSDLWVGHDYGYTGTWGGVGRTGVRGDAIKVWRVSGAGDPALVDSVIFTAINTVSDLQVSDDGKFLAVTAEGQTNGGLYLLSLADPAKPVVASATLVDRGLHTGTIATIGGRQFVFGAKNPPDPALMVFDVTGVVSSTATGPRSSAAR